MTEMDMEEEYGPKVMRPIHPGEILNEEFLAPMNITQEYLAGAIGVDVCLIRGIVTGCEPISAETALLLSKFFGTSAELWAGLQSQYDLEMAEDSLADRLAAVEGYFSE